MTRPAVLLPLLFLALTLVLPAPADAERPEFALKLAVERDKVTLGEKIPFTVTLSKRKGKAVQVNTLRLARNSVSLRVKLESGTRTITRIYGHMEGAQGKSVVRDDKSPMQELKRGKDLELALPVLAIRTGTITFSAVYAGLPKGKGPAILVSEPVAVTVVAPEGKKEIAALMETSVGTMIFTFGTDRTFNTSLNFLTLAKKGFYNGLTFHRVYKGFMAQGGDPKGNGLGGPGYYIHREIDPPVKHVRGVLSMARADAPDSAGSQFFVMFGAKPILDGAYSAYGKLIEGEETLEKLEATETVVNPQSRELSKPVKAPVIRKVEVITR